MRYKNIKSKIKICFLRSVLAYDLLRGEEENIEGKEASLRNWDVSSGPQGHLVIEGCNVVELVEKYGTPLYIINKRRLEKDYNKFINSFRNQYMNTELSYSYKTNPLPRVLQMLHEMGAGAEVISPFELWLALKLGVQEQKIIYNGPGKGEEGLDLAISRRIKLINIDGPTEIEIIERLGKKYGHKQQVGVRVVSSIGWSGQFGFVMKNGKAISAFSHLKTLKHVIPCGIHIHLGTTINNIQDYVQAIKEILEFSVLLRRELGIKIKYFDIGGGFSVPTVRNYSRLDRMLQENGLPHRKIEGSACPTISEYGSSIIELFRRYNLSDQGEPPTIIMEPGRAITSSAQCLVLKVIGIKPAQNGNSIIIVDGGINIARPISWEHHEILAASKMNTPSDESYSIYGPLCFPNDILYGCKKLPKLEPGDILAIMDAGAYFIPNQMNFSFPRPSVVLTESGRHELIRSRESFENIVGLDILGR
jgi:diaminopimelate decarboxylase